MSTTINKVNYRLSEAFPFERPKNPQNPHEEFASQSDIKWAKDTHIKANQSLYAHLIELPLKIVSYFVLHSDFKSNIWTKVLSAAEDLSGFFGDRFRNQIYAHKNEKGEYDDVTGEEQFTSGNKSKFSLSSINNFIQTKAGILLTPLSLINPELANDIQWSVVRNINDCWWRNMSVERAFGANFWNDLFKSNGAITGITLIKNKFIENFLNLKKSISEYRNGSKKNKKDLTLNLCNNADKSMCTLMPIIQCLNTFGDLARPIARRLEIEGFARNTIRVLSMIDRPFNWGVNLFRFYIPEKTVKNERHPDNKILPDSLPNEPGDKSDFLLGATIGDMFDFGTVLFEDQIKESSGMVNHLIEIIRRLSSSASDIYFSTRRKGAKIISTEATV